MQLTCLEKYLLNTVSPKATEHITPCTDDSDCIVLQVDFADSKVIVSLGWATYLWKDLGLNPLRHFLHEFVKIGNNIVLDFKNPRSSPTELRQWNKIITLEVLCGATECLPGQADQGITQQEQLHQTPELMPP